MERVPKREVSPSPSRELPPLKSTRVSEEVVETPTGSSGSDEGSPVREGPRGRGRGGHRGRPPPNRDLQRVAEEQGWRSSSSGSPSSSLSREESLGDSSPGQNSGTRGASAEGGGAPARVSSGSRGRGGHRGERPPRPTAAQRADYVRTVPAREGFTKQAVATTKLTFDDVALTTNYYRIGGPNWVIYHYRVDFSPEIEMTWEKRKLFRPHATGLPGWHVFDGESLYSSVVVPESLNNFQSVREPSSEPVTLRISTVPNLVTPEDPVRFQVYNIIIRDCMRRLNLRQMGRNYYDDRRAVSFPQEGLEIWPGFKTSIRQHEHNLLLCVEMTNKVLRKETALDIIDSYRCNRGTQQQAQDELLGTIVMTEYNKRTYRVDDVNWSESPLTTFSMQGTDVSYVDYYRTKYNVTIRQLKQPILYCKAKKNDIRRGMSTVICLIPELCRMTGLKDEQRKNFGLMRKLSGQLQMDPAKRVEYVRSFGALMVENQVSTNLLEPSRLRLDHRNLVGLKGKVYHSEKVSFGCVEPVVPPKDRYDWSKNVVQNPMYSTVDLIHWAVITPQLDGHFETFIQLIGQTARSMNFKINPTYQTSQVSRNRGQQHMEYMKAIDELMNSSRGQLQMIVCILPSPDENLYAAIKRKCYVEWGVSSQCIQNKHISASRGKEHMQRGVASKLAIQMNTKLGGVPWKVTIPMRALMTVGFNVSTMARNRDMSRGMSSGALVASLNDDQTRYYSTTVEHEEGQFLSTQLGMKLLQALKAYQDVNDRRLPGRIIFYRDGVGEGQLQPVVDTEVSEIRKRFLDYYQSQGQEPPKFGFIVVNKRLNTKFFAPGQRGQQYSNPLPGTVVDDVVTLPERYDFYLIASKGTGQGTVSPTSYNVVYDDIGLDAAKVQYLTFKLCHLYYNWASTVSVPAPCQYAHKLAFLQNLIRKSGGQQAAAVQAEKQELAKTLFYL